MLAVKCQWGSFGHPIGMYTADEMAYGIHGGDVETSLMQAFRPDCVNMSKAVNFRSAAETDLISPIGSISRGWIASDLNLDGTVGDASLATADKGAATADHQVAGFTQLLRDVVQMPVPTAPATRG